MRGGRRGHLSKQEESSRWSRRLRCKDVAITSHSGRPQELCSNVKDGQEAVVQQAGNVSGQSTTMVPVGLLAPPPPAAVILAYSTEGGLVRSMKTQLIHFWGHCKAAPSRLNELRGQQ